MNAEERHMDSQCDSYKKAESDHNRSSFESWKERLLRVEEPFIKSKERKEEEERAHNAECIKTFIQMAHDSPEWHLGYMSQELEWETFCLLNKIKYEPSWRGGVPGYWDFRKQHAQEWILNTRERLPNE